MRDARFESLRLELLEGGVTPVYVERTILELAEHYADLEARRSPPGSAPKKRLAPRGPRSATSARSRPRSSRIPSS